MSELVEALRGIQDALSEVAEALPWPGSEHVGWRVQDVKAAIDKIAESEGK